MLRARGWGVGGIFFGYYMNITPATYMRKQKKKGMKRNPWLFYSLPACSVLTRQSCDDNMFLNL